VFSIAGPYEVSKSLGRLADATSDATSPAETSQSGRQDATSPAETSQSVRDNDYTPLFYHLKANKVAQSMTLWVHPEPGWLRSAKFKKGAPKEICWLHYLPHAVNQVGLYTTTSPHLLCLDTIRLEPTVATLEVTSPVKREEFSS
jgi:hypothetical protein